MRLGLPHEVVLPNRTLERVRGIIVEIRCRVSDAAEAWRLVNGVDQKVLFAIPNESTLLALHRRVQGLIWLHDNQAEKARVALDEAMLFEKQRSLPGHWLIKRLQSEVQQVRSALP